MSAPTAEETAAGRLPEDPRSPVDRLMRDLRARREGLAGREAARRLVVYGPNELSRRDELRRARVRHRSPRPAPAA